MKAAPANVVAGVLWRLSPVEHNAMPTSWDIPGVVRAPRIGSPYPCYGTEEYRAFQAALGGQFNQPQTGVHSGAAPLKGSPISGRNAIFG
jgi:hypothetical protein